MDKLDKFLFKLSKAERQFFRNAILVRIKRLDLKCLDIKPLKGYKNLYRVRYKKIRVVFYKDNSNHIGIIVDIDTRDKIYKNL